jgi:hypothetical protein
MRRGIAMGAVTVVVSLRCAASFTGAEPLSVATVERSNDWSEGTA